MIRSIISRRAFTPLEKVHSVRGRSSLTGFTLLELLFVILIISVILGLSMPLIKKSVNKASFKAFVDKSYFLLDYAKSYAILKTKVLEVKLDLKERKIVLSERESGNKDGDKLLEIKIPESIKVESQKENIPFFPDGTMEEFEIIFSDGEAGYSRIYSKSNEGRIVRKDEK